jgi:hypothetical protein
MGNTYKRKRITNLGDLDREEAKLRKKAKQIEQDWAEMLDPQQLAINLLMKFVESKITGKTASKKSKPTNAPQKENEEKTNQPSQKSPVLKMAKVAGISLLAWFIIKKIWKNKATGRKTNVSS